MEEKKLIIIRYFIKSFSGELKLITLKWFKSELKAWYFELTWICLPQSKLIFSTSKIYNMDNIKDYDDEGMQNKKLSGFRYSMWFLVFIFEIDCICNIQWTCVNYIRTFYYVNIGGVYVLITSVYVVEFVFEYSVFHARAMPYTALLLMFF